MPRHRTPLSPKERAFVLAYTGAARGNATQAAILAGYSKRSAAEMGSRTLRKVNVAAALAKLAKRDEQKAERARLSHARRDEILEDIALDPTAPAKDRRGAIAELNRVDGRHSVRHVHEGTLSLEDVLGKSWED
jgi:phage terminase small subunit